jgi:predicted DNA-binding protein YlxM (UPF0122 family)
VLVQNRIIGETNGDVMKNETKELSKEQIEIMEFWGADDCRFSVKEMAKILNTTTEAIQKVIQTVKENFPKAYCFYAEHRNRFNKQSKSEDNIKKLSNDFIDEEFAWESNTLYSHPFRSYDESIKKHKLSDERDDE